MPLYLLHGALGAAVQLEPLRERLASFADVHVVELAGHGATPLGDREFSIPGFVDQFIERLGSDRAGRVDVFGYSMGGYVALGAAHLHPLRIGKVMTLGTKFEWTPDVAARDAARLDVATIRAKVPQYADALEARHRGAGGWETNLMRTAALLRSLGERPYLDADVLASITQPACIVVGDRDETVSGDECTRTAALLANGTTVVLPDTPHPFERVDHALLASAVISFMSS